MYINSSFGTKQQAFLDFVLQHYVTSGVDELSSDKLTPLLRLRYHNAIADLGQPDQIRQAFVSFQQYLYQPAPLQA